MGETRWMSPAVRSSPLFQSRSEAPNDFWEAPREIIWAFWAETAWRRVLGADWEVAKQKRQVHHDDSVSVHIQFGFLVFISMTGAERPPVLHELPLLQRLGLATVEQTPDPHKTTLRLSVNQNTLKPLTLLMLESCTKGTTSPRGVLCPLSDSNS